MRTKAARLLLIFAAWDFPFFPSSGWVLRRLPPRLGFSISYRTSTAFLHLARLWCVIWQRDRRIGGLEVSRSRAAAATVRSEFHMNSASQPLTCPSTELNLSQKNSFCRARNFPAVSGCGDGFGKCALKSFVSFAWLLARPYTFPLLLCFAHCPLSNAPSVLGSLTGIQ